MDQPQPLVSVICLCYNHERYVTKCLKSVITQSYKNLEIIVVDDCSTDNSRDVIEHFMEVHPEINYLSLEKNHGNCAAFNRGLAQARGKYIVDLATDDVFVEDRIEKQILLFESLPDDYGVVYTNTLYIGENDNAYRNHEEYLKNKGLIKDMPTGNIYEMVLKRYFISAPSMLVRTEVFEELKGYDEDLAYEDFDFWVRSSRNWKYAYINEPLTLVRKTKGSMSTFWYAKGDKQLHSTYLVCKKTRKINRATAERKALIERVQFELRQSTFSNNHSEADNFYVMLKELEGATLMDKVFYFIHKCRLPLAPLRKLYYKIWYP